MRLASLVAATFVSLAFTYALEARFDKAATPATYLPTQVSSSGKLFGRDGELVCSYTYRRNGSDFVLEQQLADGMAEAILLRKGELFGFFKKTSEDGYFVVEHASLPMLSAAFIEERSRSRGSTYLWKLLLVEPSYFIGWYIIDLDSSPSAPQSLVSVVEKEMGQSSDAAVTYFTSSKNNGFDIAIETDSNSQKLLSIYIHDRSDGSIQRYAQKWSEIGVEEVGHSIRSEEQWSIIRRTPVDDWAENVASKIAPSEYGYHDDTVVIPAILVILVVTLLMFMITYLRRREQRRFPASESGRGGFTLLEAVVAIGGIGLILGLLLPAVQYSRESARRTACMTNSRELGSALLQYELGHREFPSGGWSKRWIGLADRSGSRQPGGWIFNILHQLEIGQLRGNFPDSNDLVNQDRDKFLQVSTFRIPVLHCPSKFDRSRLEIPTEMVFGEIRYCQKPDYALNAGPAIVDMVWQGPRSLDEAASSEFEWPKDEALGIARRRTGTRVAEITDGLSSTLLVGEKRTKSSGSLAQMAFGNDSKPYFSGFGEDTVRFTGFPTTVGYILQNDGASGPTLTFGGPHPSLTIFGFCDGSVHQLSNHADRMIIGRLGHISDGESVMPIGD